jgi:hypothetical protein
MSMVVIVVASFGKTSVVTIVINIAMTAPGLS